MLTEIKKVEQKAELLFGSAEVERAIQTMAMDISTVLHERNPLILCVMNGGVVTMGKLLMGLNFPCTVDSINVSRYGDHTQGGNKLNWLYTPVTDLAGRTILIVDDVLDFGITMAAIHAYCVNQGAEDIYSAVLIDKKIPQVKAIQADFVGLEAEDKYLFGYGMDYKGYLRNANGIYACQEDLG